MRRPHRGALFSLIPVNAKADAVVQDVDNAHLVSSSWKHNVPSFDIGFHIGSQHSINTLVTLGRDDCDICLRPKAIARTQCSFEIDDLDTGIIMFYDRSHKQNTRVSGSSAQLFEKGRSPRKVLVWPGINDEISMGGINGETFEFEIEWLVKEGEIQKTARDHREAGKRMVTNPRVARTRDPTETVAGSAIMSPDEAFISPHQLGMRYFRQKMLGSGSFGTVWRAIDVDSGRVMAVKRCNYVQGSQPQEYVQRVRREVELMRRAKHVS